MGVSLSLGLARGLPPRPGHALADFLGSWFGSLSRLVQVKAVAANQWVVAGGGLSSEELRRRTRAVYRSTARFLYDFYHFLDDPPGMLSQIVFDPSIERVIALSRENCSGQLVVIPHYGPFDLIGRAVVLHGLRVLALSFPLPPSGYRLQNRIRRLEGLEIAPISFSALHKAAIRLQQGGTVVTGIDRPLEKVIDRPLFFGRPSNLPIGWVRLALKAGAPVVVISGYVLPDGRYFLMALDPIQLTRYENRSDEVVCNAEAVLAKIEALIRQAPELWSMFYPVWPEALDEIKAL